MSHERIFPYKLAREITIEEAGKVGGQSGASYAAITTADCSTNTGSTDCQGQRDDDGCDLDER